ncbi:MAG TPA: helix-hairpin-helix domain-containing protein, partial [Abditibacteriaceae bacterium]|nr:helix-hairpin-helix domain-containing protein [Abditibacteriaceae bacterium]
MQNAAVAQVFEDIADCLEIAGENVFKIRAYRRAAEAVATFPEAIEDALEAGTLDDIEGLGAATIAKTKEFLATGRVAELERLREQYPAGLLELLRVPGLGPKKIAQLYKERGIGSIETLQSAIANDELKGLSGFGPKTIDNIAQGIRRVGEMCRQVPLGDALPAAFGLAKALQTGNRVLDVAVLEPATGAKATDANATALDVAIDVVVAGEIRRGCDTISQIVLVATDEDSELLPRFAQLPQVKNVVSQDDFSATIQVRPGIEARLEIAPRPAFGSALFRATGSDAHVQHAEIRARELNVSLENFADEEALYRALGVAYIPPEMREGKGEWQLSQDGQMPRLIEIGDIKGDLHAH